VPASGNAYCSFESDGSGVVIARNSCNVKGACLLLGNAVRIGHDSCNGDGACTEQAVVGASKALVLTSPGRISVAVFQDDGDIVALTADTSFGNNGTTTSSLGLTVDQLLAAAADPRLDLPGPADQLLGAVGTQ